MKNLVENDGFDLQEDYSNESNSEDIFIKQTTFIESKAIKIKCFYQIMYYIFHNGRKRTSLHTMTGQKCKSRVLIKTLNRIGVSSCYNEVRRVRRNLENYCFSTATGHEVPIPSHFTADKFTLAQMDNFDHADRSSPTGMKSNHDTVMILTQIKPENTPPKPSFKDFALSKTRKDGFGKLPCQNRCNYNRKTKDFSLKSNFKVEERKNDFESNIDIKNFILNYIRSLSQSEENPIPTWAGCKSLISSSNLPIMHVTFIPYLPYSVTKFATVYTPLRNFQSVLHQLNQEPLPLFCDERVFCIVADITLQRSEEFKNIVPMMGSFHFAKAEENTV